MKHTFYDIQYKKSYRKKCCGLSFSAFELNFCDFVQKAQLKYTWNSQSRIYLDG